MHKKHKNISVEQIEQLKQGGLLHAGYDAAREREIFHRAMQPGTTTNPRRIRCELVNTSKWELIIARVEDAPPPRPGDFSKKLFSPGSLVILDYGYEFYQVRHRDGSPYQGPLLINYGDAIGKGNRLPSRPEAPGIKVFRRK